MTILFLFAYLWGVFQLFIIATPARTVRLRTLIIAFLSGMYVSSTIALLIEKIYISDLATRSAPMTIDAALQAGITVSPFIEEIAKLLPLLIILCWARVKQRLGVADIMLLGAAMGAGFGFAEGFARLIHGYDEALLGGFAGPGNWTIFFGMNSYTIPGILTSICSWLPIPLGSGVVSFGASGPSTINFLGQQFNAVTYNYHLVWTTLAAFGLGIFFRAPKKRLAWLALLIPIWVGAIHAFSNFSNLYALAHDLQGFEYNVVNISPIWDAILTVSGAIEGFGRFTPIYVLLAIVFATIADRRRIGKALAGETQLKWSEDTGKSRLDRSNVRVFLSLFRYLKLKGIALFKDFIFGRRSFALLSSLNPNHVELEKWRNSLHVKRNLLESMDKVKAFQSYLQQVTKQLRASSRFRILQGLRIFLAILFFVPSITYIFISAFPATQSLQEFFMKPFIFNILKGMSTFGVLFLVVRLLLFYRFLPLAKSDMEGQGFARYLLRGIITHVVFIIGVVPLLFASSAAPSDKILDLLHIYNQAGILTYLDWLIVFLGLISILLFVFAITPPLWFLFIQGVAIAIDGYLAVKKAVELSSKGIENLDEAEKLEFALAIVNFGFSFFGLASLPAGESIFKTVLEILGLRADVADLMMDYEVQVTKFRTQFSWSNTRNIQSLFNHIRAGDQALLDHRYGEAHQHYTQAQRITTHMPITAITRAAIMARVGNTLKSQGDYSGAINAYQDALDQLPSANVLPQYQGFLKSQIGDVYIIQENYSEAIESYKQALEILQDADAGAAEVSEVMVKLGEALIQHGDTSQALQYFQDCLELLRNIDEASLDRAELFEQLGDGFLSASDPEQASECFRLGLEDYQAMESPLAEDLMEKLDDMQ